jgi:hypothetical protein
MPLNEHPSEHGTIDLSEDRARAVDEAGRRAGAALRSPAPAHGAAAVRDRAQRRRVVRAAAATAGVGVLVVAGLMAFTTGDQPGKLQPADNLTNTSPAEPDATTPDSTMPGSTPPASTPPASTAAPSTVEARSTNPPAPAASMDLVEAGTLFGRPWPRYSADSSLLAIESPDGNVLIHDAATLAHLRELPCPTSIEPLPDSVGTAPASDRVWDVAAAARWDADAFTVLTSVSRPQMCEVTVSADGRRAVTDADVRGIVPRDARSLLWDTSDGSLVAVIPGMLSGFSADGSRLVISNGPSFSIVESSTGTVLDTITDDANGTVASPDGSRLLRWATDSHADGTQLDATIYDMRTLTPIAKLSAGSPDEVVGIEDPVFDDSNGRVAALTASGLAIWDASTGAQLQHVDIELVDGRSVAFFPGGAMIAVRNGSHITIIDSSSGAELADLDLGADRVEELVFSADGVSLAAGVSAGARVWFYEPS